MSNIRIHQPIRILLIEENFYYMQLVRRFLTNAIEPEIQIDTVINLSNKIRHSTGDFIDAVILGFPSSHSQGLRIFNRVRRDFPGKPVIILCHPESECYARQLVRDGAFDYCLKSRMTEDLLIRIIQYAVEFNTLQKHISVKQTKSQGYLDTSKSIIVVTGLNHNVLMMNKKGFEVLEYERSEVIGKNWFDIFVPEYNRDKEQTLIRNFIEDNHKFVDHFETSVLTGSGKEKMIAWRCVPVKNRRNNVTGIIMAGNDITRKKRLENKIIELERILHHSQKMHALGQLSSGIAHDFNNLLTSIICNIDLAALKTGGKGGRNLEIARNAAVYGTGLIEQILSFSRNSSGSHSLIKVNEIIHDIYSIIRSTVDRNIRITFHACTENPVVRGNASQINSLLMNLCLNARDAIKMKMEKTQDLISDQEFFIDITCEKLLISPEDSVNIPHAYPGYFTVISVVDNGIGMDQKTQKLIFKPFFTTKSPDAGTGLGLANVFRVIQQHRGWIHCHSEPGTGTTFKIFFPLIEENLSNHEANKFNHLPCAAIQNSMGSG